MPYLKQTSKLFLSPTLACALACALVPACDKADESKKEDKVEEKSEADKQLEATLAAKKAKRDAEAKALEDQTNAVAALAVLPEEMPKDVEAACVGAAEAYDKFMQTHYDGDGLAKWDAAKEGQMEILKSGCIAEGNLEAAACQINALSNAPGELKKEVTSLIDACKAKFAAGAAAPT